MANKFAVTVLQRQRECFDRRKGKEEGDIIDSSARRLVLPHGMVIDNGCSDAFLSVLECTRLELPLDSKRPTCDRRFLVDEGRTIVSELESIVQRGLFESGMNSVIYDNYSRESTNQRKKYSVFINKYLRILEYTIPGSELLPHCDGSKICDETGNKSTHTLLLFLKHCEDGGETLFLDGHGDWSKQTMLTIEKSQRFQHVMVDSSDDSNNLEEDPIITKKAIVLSDILSNKQHVQVGIQPILGRILLFPHQWPHAGALCSSVPKIALRAEVTIF